MNKILEDYYKVREDHDAALSLLEEATQRIVDVIKSIFKRKDAWWSYKFYHDGDDDPPLPEELDRYGKEPVFPIYIDAMCDSGKWCYNEGFPIIFFDMTDDEIKDHIKKEILQFEEEEKIKKEKEKKKKEERLLKQKQLKESAYKKLVKWKILTKEEKKALGI